MKLDKTNTLGRFVTSTRKERKTGGSKFVFVPSIDATSVEERWYRKVLLFPCAISAEQASWVAKFLIRRFDQDSTFG